MCSLKEYMRIPVAAKSHAVPVKYTFPPPPLWYAVMVHSCTDHVTRHHTVYFRFGENCRRTISIFVVGNCFILCHFKCFLFLI